MYKDLQRTGSQDSYVSPPRAPSRVFPLASFPEAKSGKIMPGQECPGEVRHYPDSTQAVFSDLGSTSMEKVRLVCKVTNALCAMTNGAITSAFSKPQEKI